MTGKLDREIVVRTYLRSMEAGDLAATLACFEPAAVIFSPVYGEVAVVPFYEKLFADTVSAEVDIHTIYASPSVAHRWAAHFGYRWARNDGSVTATDLVDLFEFRPGGNLIERLKIVFDPTTSASVSPAGP